MSGRFLTQPKPNPAVQTDNRVELKKNKNVDVQVLACYYMYGWQDEIWSRTLSKLLPEFDKLSDAQTAIWITMRQDLTALWCYHSDRSFYPQRLWFATSTITLHTSNWNAHIWPARNIARWRSNASLPMWSRGVLAGRLCVFSGTISMTLPFCTQPK